MFFTLSCLVGVMIISLHCIKGNPNLTCSHLLAREGGVLCSMACPWQLWRGQVCTTVVVRAEHAQTWPGWQIARNIAQTKYWAKKISTQNASKKGRRKKAKICKNSIKLKRITYKNVQKTGSKPFFLLHNRNKLARMASVYFPSFTFHFNNIYCTNSVNFWWLMAPWWIIIH